MLYTYMFATSAWHSASQQSLQPAVVLFHALSTQAAYLFTHVRSLVCLPQLVLINVSDHHTRTKANTPGGGGAVPRVMGCLLGQQSGRTVDISNSFEMKYDQGPEGLVINVAFLQKKMEQCEWHCAAGGRSRFLSCLAQSTVACASMNSNGVPIQGWQT